MQLFFKTIEPLIFSLEFFAFLCYFRGVKEAVLNI